jgi:death-on-curing protein
VRYLTAPYLYYLWLTLRTIASASGEGQSFNPPTTLELAAPKLESAAARPRLGYQGQEAHPSLFSKAAALGHGIAANHCFQNGNKRTAFMAMSQMLHANGWTWNPPSDIVAFVMLRTASNHGRMDIDEIAAFIGAYASRIEDKRQRFVSDSLINTTGGIIEHPDIFPAEVVESQEHYYKVASKALARHSKLMTADEEEMLRTSFMWPSDLGKKMMRWYNMERHRRRMLGWILRRKRCKRIGKRRCKHKGGRTVKKICPPITRDKLGYRTPPP